MVKRPFLIPIDKTELLTATKLIEDTFKEWPMEKKKAFVLEVSKMAPDEITELYFEKGRVTALAGKGLLALMIKYDIGA